MQAQEAIVQIEEAKEHQLKMMEVANELINQAKEIEDTEEQKILLDVTSMVNDMIQSKLMLLNSLENLVTRHPRILK